ncbi:hypothetical protein HanPSC8_Chr10g0410701 [Helianthus annuus]|nr:hypothetical protein HanPSC8_Chr10g0410701 [Helianthus annuus]
MILLNLPWAIFPKVPHIPAGITSFIFPLSFLSMLRLTPTRFPVVSHFATVVTLPIFTSPGMMTSAPVAFR